MSAERSIFFLVLIVDQVVIRNKCVFRMYRRQIRQSLHIKTAQDAETDFFSRESLKYGYHVQAAHYIDAYYKSISSKTPEWYFIVVEKTEPYCVNILKADIGFLDYGFVVRQELMEQNLLVKNRLISLIQ